MHEFAEEYVVNLQPREERFYTRLGDDFFVATFPNGVKTWVHMYEVNGHTRRQTIGVYPEMPLQKALDALFSARRAQAVDAQLATQGMDNPQVRMTEDSPIDLTAKIQTIKLPRMGRRFLAGALSGGSIVGLVVAVVGWVFVGSGQPTQTPVTAADDSADSVVAVAAEPELVEERKKAPSVAAQVAREVSAATEAPVATVVPAETETKAPDPGKAQRALLQLQEDLA
ncbi:MAG: hypothetical protein OES99_12660, partial [Gammaproteobacteria bacterium]|nr:hypothetical protein [Gammaproteobacteria bacterium]